MTPSNTAPTAKQKEIVQRPYFQAEEDENRASLRDTNPAKCFGLNIRLSSRLDGTKTTGSFQQGILTLKVPVSEEAKPRVIEVK